MPPDSKPKAKASTHFERYGMRWARPIDDLGIEMEMVKRGGAFKDPAGNTIGNGLLWHWLRAKAILWPDWKLHRWNRMQTDAWLSNRMVGVIGPASSGKTNTAATDVLLDWYCFPDSTTTLVCSTSKEQLENRIWGEVKKYHQIAKRRFAWLPGHLIEGRLRIIFDSADEVAEGRDFRCGLQGVPCKLGDRFRGLSDYVGMKNKRVRLVVDEAQLMPRVISDVDANLDKNPDFKKLAMGNIKEATDALGMICEPRLEDGGWDRGIDQEPGSKVWKTQCGGVCVQLRGSDSPNLDAKLGIPLITQYDIDRDIARYGKNSWQYFMMDEGIMPRGQGARRVITREMCYRFGAVEDPHWLNTNRTRVAFLDAAYKGVGGDRCVFGELQFGYEANITYTEKIASALIAGRDATGHGRQVIALIDTVTIPIDSGENSTLPEDQIVMYVREECAKRGIPPENFFFDSGMRTSLVSAFCRVWSPRVNPVDCGGKPSQRSVSGGIETLACDYYSKFITELWYSVRLIVEAGQFRGMTPNVMLEFAAREFETVGANKIEVEPKDAMKQKTGRSPDLADAVAIGCEGARRLGFEIASVDNPEQSREETTWKREWRERADSLWSSRQLNYAI